MAIETFTWIVQGNPEGGHNQRVRSAQFGDGYKQVAGDGINPEMQDWPLTFHGISKDIIPVLNFVRRHTIKSCLWVPPFGSVGLWRVKPDSIKTAPVGGNVMSLSFTFEQSFAP